MEVHGKPNLLITCKILNICTVTRKKHHLIEYMMMTFRYLQNLLNLRIIVTILFVVVTIFVSIISALRDTQSSFILIEWMWIFSSNLGNFVSKSSSLLPFGLAFWAGIAAAFNPCGFPLLPTYLLMYLRTVENSDNISLIYKLFHACLLGIIMSSGCMVLFLAVGVALGAGVHFIVDYLDFVIFIVGFIMCILGGWMIIRGQLYFIPVQQGSNYITSFNVSGNLNYFLWGLGYGLVSLGCTLPVFLAVSGISFISSSITGVVLQFLLYGLGMSLVIIIMMILISITREATSRIRILVPYMIYVGPILMVLTGGYLIYYWIKVSELLS